MKNIEMEHEVWKRLHVLYYGTSIVKDVKLYIFVDKYEKFKMLERGRECDKDVP